MALPAAIRALEHRDYRLFWSTQLVSMTGTWMHALAQAWLVLELTRSPFQLGLVSTLQFGPFLLFSIFAGVVVDRAPKRKLIIWTQVARGLQAAILAALVFTGHVRYWHVAVLALVAGLVNTLEMPARQAFMMDLVGRADLLNAVALNSAVFNAARTLGPALGGLMIAQWGAGGAFAFNAVAFLGPIAALMAVRNEGYGGPRPRGSVLEEIGEGIAYAARTPRIAFVMTLLLGVSLFVFNYNVMVPLFARQVLDADARGLGFLMSALGVGALAGAVGQAILSERRPRLRMIIGTALALAVTSVALAFTRHFTAGMALLFVMGVTGIVFMTGCNTTVQLGVPDVLRGRVMALYSFVFVGVTPIGSFLMGWIAEHAGVAESYFVGGLACLLIVVAVTVWNARARPVRPA
jgi:MFS family permease